jgi:hypothetical protein
MPNRGTLRIMVNHGSALTLLGYAYTCLIYLSFLYLESPVLEMHIEP